MTCNHDESTPSAADTCCKSEQAVDSHTCCRSVSFTNAEDKETVTP